METFMLKKINLFIVLAALAGFVSQSVQAVIVRGEVWRKQRSDGTYQTLYCLGDAHYTRLYEIYSQLMSQGKYTQGVLAGKLLKKLKGLDEVGQKQKEQLYHALYAQKDENIVMVEDLFADENGQDLYPQHQSYKDYASKNEFIFGITQGCVSRNVPVINLECRQAKRTKLEHIGLLSQKPVLIAQEKLVDALGVEDYVKSYLPVRSQEIDSFERSIEEMESETDVALQEIEEYRSGPFLNISNAKDIAKYKALRKNFIDNVSQAKFYDCNQAMMRDLSLLDLKAINHIHTSFDIVLAMGYAHIKNIVNILPALGYEKVREDGCTVSDLEELINAWDEVKLVSILETVINQGRMFNVASFVGFNQLRFIANEVVSIGEQQPVNVLDPDKLLVSLVHNYPTRFPFCLLLPKVAKYLKEEGQLKKASIVDNTAVIQSITQDQDIKL